MASQPSQPGKHRSKLQDIEVLKRLKESRDFAIFLDHVRERVEGAMRSSIKMIATPQEQAEHNYLMGSLNSLQVIACLVDDLYKEELRHQK